LAWLFLAAEVVLVVDPAPKLPLPPDRLCGPLSMEVFAPWKEAGDDEVFEE
jgi:hypothetical protein